MRAALFLIGIIFVGIVPIAYAQLSDKTGLKQDLTIFTDGYEFEVEVVANFFIEDYEFSADNKALTIYLASGVENNLAEIIIPVNLINGNFTFFLDDTEYYPKVKTNEKISFITTEFSGNGTHKLEIIGSTYLPEFSDIAPLVLGIGIIAILILKQKKRI